MTDELIVASGLCWLSSDELQIIAGVRLLKQQGAGDMYVKMDSGAYTTFNCKPDCGNPKLLNAGLRIDMRKAALIDRDGSG